MNESPLPSQASATSAAGDFPVAAPPLRQFVAAALVLLAAAALTFYLFATRERVETVAHERTRPRVDVVTASARAVPVLIASQGRIVASARVELTSQLGARVVTLGPNFEDGASVAAGEVLFELERADFELALADSRAHLAESEAALAIEAAAGESAVAEWKLLDRGEPNALARREPQLAQARARVDAARARVSRAELDIDRTRVVAPFDGRVARRAVELGQYVAPGRALGELVGRDRFEVRLSIGSGDRPYLPTAQELQLALDGDGPGRVYLDPVGGRNRQLVARLVRTAAEVDPRTQTLEAIAEIEADATTAVDLLAGAFVHAHIVGRSLESAIVLPRSALRGGDHVLVLGANSQIFMRPVDVLRRDAESVVVRSGLDEAGRGLADGERVVVSPLAVAADGMTVEVRSDGATGESTNEVR